MNLPFKGNNRITQIWKGAAHYGLDIVGDNDITIRAVASGTVIVSTIVTNKANRTWEWGNYVCVRGTDGKQYYYCHMQSRAAKVGERVNVGDELGIMGNTGFSFGAHLHLQIRDSSNRELNVADVIDVPNKIGVYMQGESITPPAPQPAPPAVGLGLSLFKVTVSLGDLALFNALAGKLFVKPTIAMVQRLFSFEVRVSTGDLISFSALASKLLVTPLITEL